MVHNGTEARHFEKNEENEGKEKVNRKRISGRWLGVYVKLGESKRLHGCGYRAEELAREKVPEPAE